MKRYVIYLLGTALVVLFGAGCKEKKELKFSDQAIEKKIDSLLLVMTLEEKIGQMTLFTSDWDITGPVIRGTYKEDIKAGKVGGIFNAYGVAYTRKLQQLAVDSTRLHIPLIFGYDVIHGYKTIFPIPLGEAASWDLEAIEKSARIAATEATAEGLHWTFAPMVDIARDPRWGRICEGSGEDPYLGSLIAKARVNGFQNHDLYATNTLVACAKHYAAYGAALAGRDYNTVDISSRTLREVYLPPYKAAVEAGVGTIMTSFNELNGIPATGNSMLLTDILRYDWGFQGFVVTDYTSINELVPHGIVANEKEAGELALNAGVDMDMQGAVYLNYLAKSQSEGKVSTGQIDEAVRHILRIKFALGLFDYPYRYCDEQREKELVMSRDNLDHALDIARKSIVLLKNQGNILPLRKDLGTIAVIGPLANSKRDLIGSWSAAGDPLKCTSLLEGIRKKVPEGTSVIYAKGSNINDDSTAYLAEAVNIARRADAVILAVGEAAWMSGEAASRGSIDLPGIQYDLVKQVLETGKPVVIVLMNGRPLALQWMDDTAPAILETWFLGTRAGDAIADVIFGDYNPSGKLTVTFPRNIGQVPIFYSTKNTGRPIDKDNKYTSKYLDMPNSPLYPFGYGLSYTKFNYSNIKLSSDTIHRKDTLLISLNVRNTGKWDGEEIVQLYTRDLVGSVTRPLKELKGFQKIFIKAGESADITFKITREDLRFYDRNMNFNAEPGDFIVFVGTNSEEAKEARFTLAE
jgi:beta-glucosidase